MSRTILVYVQHLLGIGHQRRAATIARALARRGLRVCYVSGGMPVPGLDTGAAEHVQLPPARARDASYAELLDADGRAVDDGWRARRRAALLEALERTRPAALLIETFPFGRRMFRFELIPLLEAARASHPRPRVYSSVRDILEPKRKPGRNEEIVASVERYFDAVLMHADRRFVSLGDSFALAERIEARVRYTGFVVDAPETVGSSAGSGEVVVSAGGGVVGERLLRAAMRARELTEEPRRTWRCLVGHNLPEGAFRALAAEPPAGVLVERNRADFPDLLRNCAVSVSQGGYNTVYEALAAGARMVICPFCEHGETEQSARAALLSRRGAAALVPVEKLSPRALASAVDGELGKPRQRAPDIDTGGADNTAACVDAGVGGLA